MDLENEETQQPEMNEYASVYSALEGNWRWTKSFGGFAGHEITPATEGYTRCLEISDQTIRFMTNDTLEYEAEFEVALGRSIYSLDSIPMLKIGGVLAYTYELGAQSIILRDNFYDGYEHEYVSK